MSKAAYQAAYRLRSAVRGEILAQGWEELDALLVFRKEDGELVIVLKDGTRYSIEEPEGFTPAVPTATSAAPTGNGLPSGVDLSVVPQSIAARRALEQAGGEHSGTTESEVRTRLAKGASQFLAALKLLDTVHGPEWREKLTQMTT